ncbi:zinc-binding alcohol dehydrogenase family protein [Aspergillus homomorphus CBS 101889]|uniref:Putative zinc-binding oxidoreductase ToxD n=1 Tax=Aspergillus homomorphus (strain CBS 101889) TaxID=1450537 RepID=A0A395HPA9_ASPHC|nr:putative zinc-binding oxidoreductase ToxD [Aspergillus homomorphus CBS 101889]RAL09771.1 putative zinc-binding oxidoreductase ToxD [Aspergillus homomorphus CBS 101889]
MPLAITLTSPHTAALTHIPPPQLRPGTILVRPKAVALNPTDIKKISSAASPLHLPLGCDYAGTVLSIDPSTSTTTDPPFQPGDRVFGFISGCNPAHPSDGAFSTATPAITALQLPIPDHLSYTEAATLGIALTTIGQSLYQTLNLAAPETPLSTPSPILIYGGSTAMGTMAIQFAKLSGYKVFTVCSPHNFPLVRSYGADEVFDYRDPGAAMRINELTGDRLELVMDTVGGTAAVEFCGTAMSSLGGEFATLLEDTVVPRENVRSRVTVAYTAMGEEVVLGGHRIPARREDYEFAVGWLRRVWPFVRDGRVKSHPVKVGAGGLRGLVEKGFEEMREGRVSGVKLVFEVEDHEDE